MIGEVVVMSLSVALIVALLAQPEAKPFVLQTEMSIWDVAVQDLNQDGQADIVALCCDDKSFPLRKQIAVFLADPAGGYPGQPSFQYVLEPRVGGAFFAEADGRPPKELVLTDSGGATVCAYTGATFEAVLQSQFGSLLPSGLREPLFLENAAVYLDGDGVEEWLVPVSEGYAVRSPQGLLCTVPCDVVSGMRGGSSLSISHKLPSYHVFPMEGGSQKGLAFLSDEFVDFAYGPNWRERKRLKIPLNLEDDWEAASQMKDIDGNGLPDLVVTQMRGTANLKMQTQVYLASAPLVYPEQPTATFHADGSIASPLLVDINKDGKLDLLFINIPFGIKFFINFFITRKVGVQVDVYVFNGTGFSAKPDFRGSVSLEAPEGRQRIAYTMGDFTGDGRMDAAFAEGATRLAVHVGTPSRFIASRPWLVLDLPAFGSARTYDLNRNASDDIVIFHPHSENKQRIEVVVF
jgi:hypothetical protein